MHQAQYWRHRTAEGSPGLKAGCQQPDGGEGGGSEGAEDATALAILIKVWKKKRHDRKGALGFYITDTMKLLRQYGDNPKVPSNQDTKTRKQITTPHGQLPQGV